MGTGRAQFSARGMCLIAVLALLLEATAKAAGPTVLERREGYVDTGGAIIYYVTIGSGAPLMILHGGPGATHEYFLPYLLPLAKHRQLVFIDQRGSGGSQKLSDHTLYNLDAMVTDVEAVRVALELGKIDLLGHSFGGILAQAIAVRHPGSVQKLILASTGSSAASVNADFRKIKEALEPELRERIDELEARGIIGADGAQIPEYRELADRAQFAFNYAVRAPAWDETGSPLGWDVLTQMWGAKSDFHIDGNLAGFDFTEDLKRIESPALVIYGDQDMISDATARESASALKSAQLVRIARSAHMTFVDQNTAFIDALEDFLKGD